MKIKQIETYKFNELSEKAQEIVLNKFYDINLDHNWWEYIYEDAETIGLKINGFDDYKCEGDFLESPFTVIKLIKENHGESCETYKTALQYEKEMLACPKDEEGEYIENEMEVIEDDFRNSLLEDYRIILNKESEYLTSNGAIIGTIEANDYDFDVNGKIV